jgi:OmpA-OmpF porin, OOP family
MQARNDRQGRFFPRVNQYKESFMNVPMRPLVAGVIVASLGISAGALAQGIQTDSYLTDSRGNVSKSGFGHCWRTSQWTPAKAIAECDPDLMAKPAPRIVEAAPEPAPAPAPVVAAPPPPKPKAARIENVTLEADANFDTGRAELKPGGKAELGQLADRLKSIQIESIVVTGHADSVGGTKMNLGLSLRRAEAVKAYLEGMGVDGGMIKTVGLGETSPIADNNTVQGRAMNRRVEVEVEGERTIR